MNFKKRSFFYGLLVIHCKLLVGEICFGGLG